MRLKFCITAFLMGLMVGVSAQGGEGVPLFEDDIPNIGSSAKPQDRVRLTPSGLPDVSVHLKNTPKESVKPPVTASVPRAAKPVETRQPLVLKAGGRPSDDQSAKMNQQLNEEIEKYQKEREKAEAEKQQVRPQTVALMPTETAQMPASLVGLIGKTHDVRTFDVSGFSLGMTLDEVLENAEENGYAITKVEHGIPTHRTSFYEQRCRQAQIHRVEEIQNCILNQAKEDEVYYVSSITMAKLPTAEYMQVLLSTHATDNVVYKIYYENKGDNSLNFSRKNLAKKARRRDAFWNMIYENYGYPDDKEAFIWGDPQKAYMKAQMQGANYNAYIILEDKEIPDGDYWDAKEQQENLKYKHTFTFAQAGDEE